MQEMRVQSLEDPLEKQMEPTPVLLPGNPLDRGFWQGIHKEWDTTERIRSGTGACTCTHTHTEVTHSPSFTTLYLGGFGKVTPPLYTLVSPSVKSVNTVKVLCIPVKVQKS